MTDRDQRFSQNDSSQSSPQEGEFVIEQPSVVVPLKENQPQKPYPQKNRIHLFSGYCLYPEKIWFHDQEPDEVIILFLRKSQIVNLPWIFLSLVLFFTPLLLLLVPLHLFPFLIPLRLTILLLACYYLGIITYAFVNFVIWYYNSAIITNKRIIDIDFHQLVYKDVAETKLALVQDVSYRQVGVLGNVFDFGHVLIQTAGTIDNFEFESLPKPDKIADLVEELIGKGRVYVP